MNTPICSSVQASASTSATNFCFGQAGSLSTGWATSEATRKDTVGIAFTLSQLYVKIAVDPTNVGSSYVFTIRKNGVNTGVTVTIAAGATSAVDAINTVGFVAGDNINLQSVPSATAPVASGNVQFSFICTANANESPLFGAIGNALTASTTGYLGLQFDSNQSPTETLRAQVMPTAGVISKLYWTLDGSAGSTYTITMYLNGVATALTSAANATSGNDTTHSVAVVKGDLVSWEAIPGSTGRRVQIGCLFAPTIDGESLGMMAPFSTMAQNQTLYNTQCGAATWNSTETNRQVLCQASTVQKLIVNLAAAVGGALQTANHTIRKNAADTTVTTSIASGATTANDAVNTASFAQGDAVSIKAVLSTLTGTITPQISWVYYIAPATNAGRKLSLLGAGL